MIKKVLVAAIFLTLLYTFPLPILNEHVNAVDSNYNNIAYQDTYRELGEEPLSNNAPIQSGESPINGSIDLTPRIEHYVILNDADGDTMNATWWSNSSGTWVQFAANSIIADNENISAINRNFSDYSTTYYWSVNVSDGHGGWCNETYNYTTKANNTIVTSLTIIDDENYYQKTEVKHPLGAYQNGLSIYGVSRTYNNDDGNPDYIAWYNESSGEYGVAKAFNLDENDHWRNSASQVVFQSNGTIWYTYGSKSWGGDLNFDLLSSTEAYNYDDYTMRWDDFENSGGSSTPTVSTNDKHVFVMYREKGSTVKSAFAKFGKFNISTMTKDGSWIEIFDAEAVNGTTYGIEQLWQKYNKRTGNLFFSMNMLNNDGVTNVYGACPFIYSDDNGTTWRYVNGSAISLPLKSSDLLDDRILSPHNHFDDGILRGTGWGYSDIGQAPDDTFWMLDYAGEWTWTGSHSTSRKYPYYWYWDNEKWNSVNLTTGSDGVKSYSHYIYSIGVTKNYMVLIYSNASNKDTLYIRYSENGGRSWTKPRVAGSIPSDSHFTSGAYVQNNKYNDDVARFFVTYAPNSAQDDRDEQSIMYVKIDLDYAGPPLPNATINFYAGWNFITIPVKNNYTASSLGDSIPGCTLISKWNASGGHVQTFLVGISPPCSDFPIEDGLGYFIYVTKSSSLSVNGFALSNVSIDLFAGWNSIGWFNNSGTNASSLGQAISGCQVLSKWNASQGHFESFLVGISPPEYCYDISKGTGIYVYVDSASTWHGEG